MSRFFREPLVQFLLLGLALYVGLSWLYPQRADGSKVLVSQAVMLEFLQYRHKSFNSESAENYWAELSTAEQQALVRDFVREEVLFREALRLGLDADDQIIRQRLIEKIEFVTQGFSDQQLGPSDVEIRSYFADNQVDYLMPPTATFTHVFLSNTKRTPDELELQTSNLLEDLRENQVQFNDAALYGEDFHFHRNYVSRTPAFVTSHFGAKFSEQLFELTRGGYWTGPFESPYGLHLVMLKKIEPSWAPQYEDVAGAVLADMRQARQNRSRDEAFRRIADKYRVNYLDIPEPANGK